MSFPPTRRERLVEAALSLGVGATLGAVVALLAPFGLLGRALVVLGFALAALLGAEPWKDRPRSAPLPASSPPPLPRTAPRSPAGTAYLRDEERWLAQEWYRLTVDERRRQIGRLSALSERLGEPLAEDWDRIDPAGPYPPHVPGYVGYAWLNGKPPFGPG